jgi:hypothetical protein
MKTKTHSQRAMEAALTAFGTCDERAAAVCIFIAAARHLADTIGDPRSAGELADHDGAAPVSMAARPRRKAVARKVGRAERAPVLRHGTALRNQGSMSVDLERGIWNDHEAKPAAGSWTSSPRDPTA